MVIAMGVILFIGDRLMKLITGRRQIISTSTK